MTCVGWISDIVHICSIFYCYSPILNDSHRDGNLTEFVSAFITFVIYDFGLANKWFHLQIFFALSPICFINKRKMCATLFENCLRCHHFHECQMLASQLLPKRRSHIAKFAYWRSDCKWKMCDWSDSLRLNCPWESDNVAISGRRLHILRYLIHCTHFSIHYSCKYENHMHNLINLHIWHIMHIIKTSISSPFSTRDATTV